jgi:hypothetical protein
VVTAFPQELLDEHDGGDRNTGLKLRLICEALVSLHQQLVARLPEGPAVANACMVVSGIPDSSDPNVQSTLRELVLRMPSVPTPGLDPVTRSELVALIDATLRVVERRIADPALVADLAKNRALRADLLESKADAARISDPQSDEFAEVKNFVIRLIQRNNITIDS